MEKKSKSSVIPTKILAPDNIEILHEVEIPSKVLADQKEKGEVVLMFPSDEAKDISAMTQEELLKIKRVILIDSTWSQTKYYLRQPILNDI